MKFNKKHELGTTEVIVTCCIISDENVYFNTNTCLVVCSVVHVVLLILM